MMGTVEVAEDLVEGTGLFGPAEGLDALDEDLAGGGWVVEESDGLGDEIGKRHGVGVGGLPRAHELGLDVGRCELEYLDVGIAQLIAE